MKGLDSTNQNSDAHPTLSVLRSAERLRRQCTSWRSQGLSVGLVPTMGALHEGHLSLVRRAARQCDRVVVSIFVNPRQFNSDSDLASYPRNIERDRALLTAAGTDILFHPARNTIYPRGFATLVRVDGPALGWEGDSRPGHFEGVCTVVTKLINISCATHAYFGEKDAQQLVVVRRLVRDLNLAVKIVPCPLVRDQDGLALSSRNQLLDPEQRSAALVLSLALEHGLMLFRDGLHRPQEILAAIRSQVGQQPGVELEYAGIVDPSTFRSLSTALPGGLVVIAARIGRIRLIDCLRLG